MPWTIGGNMVPGGWCEGSGSAEASCGPSEWQGFQRLRHKSLRVGGPKKPKLQAIPKAKGWKGKKDRRGNPKPLYEVRITYLSESHLALSGKVCQLQTKKRHRGWPGLIGLSLTSSSARPPEPNAAGVSVECQQNGKGFRASFARIGYPEA